MFAKAFGKAVSFSEEFYRCQELKKRKSKLLDLILEINQICVF